MKLLLIWLDDVVIRTLVKVVCSTSGRVAIKLSRDYC